MKKIFFLTALLCASLMANAKQFCDSTLTLHLGAEIQLSCESPSDGSYRITIKGTNLDGLGGSFYNPGAVDLRTKITSSTSTQIVCEFEAASTPSLYTPLYVMCPSEQNISWPDDVEWGTCGEPEECTDKTAPTVSAVAKSDITYNSATLTITAADNDGGSGVSRYIVKNGEVQIASSSSNVITLTGLSSNTAYSLKVYAKDKCDNVSSAFDVSFTTEKFYYCSFPTGHLNQADFGDIYGRILLTIKKVNNNTIAVKAEPNNNGTKGIKYMNIVVNGTSHEYGSNDANADDLTGFREISGLESLNFTFSLTFFCNTPNWVVGTLNVAEAELCDESATDIGNTSISTTAVKVIENGQLIIIKNGIRYNALGAQMK